MHTCTLFVRGTYYYPYKAWYRNHAIQRIVPMTPVFEQLQYYYIIESFRQKDTRSQAVYKRLKSRI